MKVITYYTENYKTIVKPLLESLEKFELSYFAKEYANKGTWEENCGIKPFFIQECLEKFDEDLLWIDADAEVVQQLPLEILPTDGKMMLHILVWREAPLGKWMNELVSNVIFIPNNDFNKQIVNEWVQHQKNNPMRWDQRTLTEVLNKYKDYEFHTFPKGWAYIDKYYKQFNPDIYIVQKQISNETKETFQDQLDEFYPDKLPDIEDLEEI